MKPFLPPPLRDSALRAPPHGALPSALQDKQRIRNIYILSKKLIVYKQGEYVQKMEEQTTLKLSRIREAIIIKLLEDHKAKWTIYGLHQALNRNGCLCAYASVHAFIKALHETHHLMKDGVNYRLSNIPSTLNLLSTQMPLSGKPVKKYYHYAGLEERMDMFKKSGLSYSFTSFVGGNLYHQYIMTDKIHAYASPAQFEKKWKPFLDKNGFMPVESGSKQNVFIVLDKNPFPLSLSKEVGGFSVSPKATLVSDLLSIGGLGEELALKLMEGFKWTQKPHKSQRKR